MEYCTALKKDGYQEESREMFLYLKKQDTEVYKAEFELCKITAQKEDMDIH